MISARLGLGLVGAGRMGSTHARIIAGSVPEVSLLGIADARFELARELAAELGIRRAYPSLAELGADRRNPRCPRARSRARPSSS